MIDAYLPAPAKPDISVYYNKTCDVIRAADLLVAVSGTVTLEAAILGAPMVVIYKVSLLTKLILGTLVKMKYYSIVNIIAGREVVPELMQRQATPRRIAATVENLLQPDKLRQVQDGLALVNRKLGPPGASARAAGIIKGLLAK
jgi:lipid-A-disaccharide synthase